MSLCFVLRALLRIPQLDVSVWYGLKVSETQASVRRGLYCQNFSSICRSLLCKTASLDAGVCRAGALWSPSLSHHIGQSPIINATGR